MTKGKLRNNGQQIKLVFGEGAASGFDLDQLVEQLGLEFQALSSSAGVLIMSGIMEAERSAYGGLPGNDMIARAEWTVGESRMVT